MRSNEGEKQEKVVLFVFPEKREGAVKKHGSQSCLETYPGGRKAWSLLTDLVGQSMLMKVATLSAQNPPKAFKEGSWEVGIVAGVQKIFIQHLTPAYRNQDFSHLCRPLE